MKIITRSILVLLLLAGGYWAGTVVISSADGLTNEELPGSASDPVVTKSYVDAAIQAALGGAPISGPSPMPTAATELEIVKLEPGFTLVATGRGTEFIVRNGQTLAVSNTVDGLADVTQGKDVVAGERVENNHLLISPEPGRGIRSDSSTRGTIFVMVRGNYEVIETISLANES